MTNKAVAIFQHLDQSMVKRIDKEFIKEAQTERDLDGITILGVDEIVMAMDRLIGI